MLSDHNDLEWLTMTDRPIEPKKESDALANERVALAALNELVAMLMERGMTTVEIADLWDRVVVPGLRQPYENPADNAP